MKLDNFNSEQLNSAGILLGALARPFDGGGQDLKAMDRTAPRGIHRRGQLRNQVGDKMPF